MTTETIAPLTAAREREAALRKLSESEERRTELRRELDTLRAQLRDVTEERDAAQYLAERRGADLDVLRAQLREVTAQRDNLADVPFKDIPAPDAEAICAALDRLEVRIKGGGRMCVDVVMTDAANMAADVFDDEGELLDPLEQLAALLLLRSASSEWVRQVGAAGHEAWTAQQKATAAIRLEAAR